MIQFILNFLVKSLLVPSLVNVFFHCGNDLALLWWFEVRTISLCNERSVVL
ncbi:hypothetical protein AXX17_AT4G23730 [Arabidopsis thaliana]|uniref:Transmembrane protein n=1 Tax=Arabidopsis thaliana TaxID=3702 RepID=A0A178UVI5_ARATH|nr:hypothetical protein AXX17_AT4G23730 [Arabidopsis thaliana]